MYVHEDGGEDVGASHFCCGCCCGRYCHFFRRHHGQESMPPLLYDADVSEIDTLSHVGSPFPSMPTSPAGELLQESLLHKATSQHSRKLQRWKSGADVLQQKPRRPRDSPKKKKSTRRPRLCPRCCYRNCRCCCCCRGRHRARRCCKCCCATSWSASAIVFLLFYVALPLVLTDLFNSATIEFRTVHMEHDFHDHRETGSLGNGHHVNGLNRKYLTNVGDNKTGGTLGLFASCRLVGLKTPVDVGIEAQSMGLDVYHRGGHLGRLLPHNEVLVQANSLTGDFELPADLTILDVDRFHNFAHRLLSNDNVTWDLRTRGAGVSIRLRLDFSFWLKNAFWDLFVPGVQFNKTVTMKGCRGFHNTTLEVFTLDDGPPCVPGTPPDARGLNVHLNAKVFNPSAANVSHMGFVKFDMMYNPSTNGSRSGKLENEKESILLGTLFSDDSLSVAPGWNQLVAHGRFTAEGDFADILIQRFLNGDSTLLSAKAPEANASSDPLFSEFVGGLSISTMLKGPKRGLIKAGALLLTLELIAEILNPFRSKTKPIIVPTQIQLRNPFLAVMTITQVSFDVIYENVTVGTAIHNGIDLVIPRNGTVWMPTVNMDVRLYIPGMFDRLVRLVEKMLADGHADIGVGGNFSFRSGGLQFNPHDYEQMNNVPACLQTPSPKGQKQEHKPCPPHRKTGMKSEADLRKKQ